MWPPGAARFARKNIQYMLRWGRYAEEALGVGRAT